MFPEHYNLIQVVRNTDYQLLKFYAHIKYLWNYKIMRYMYPVILSVMEITIFSQTVITRTRSCDIATWNKITIYQLFYSISISVKMIDREIKLCKQVSEMTNKYENHRFGTTNMILIRYQDGEYDH